MKIYRKRKESNTWHWCTNCKNWPDEVEDYEEKAVEAKPDGELCVVCERYDDANTCEKR